MEQADGCPCSKMPTASMECVFLDEFANLPVLCRSGSGEMFEIYHTNDREDIRELMLFRGPAGTNPGLCTARKTCYA